MVTRRALVTGGTGAIGGAIADRLEWDGVDVTRMGQEVWELAHEGVALGYDILVNCAGYADYTPVPSRDEWHAMLDVHVWLPARMTGLCLGHMTRRRWGRVVNIASTAAITGGIHQEHYAAAKAGLVNLTMSTARKAGRAGVTANAVLPGLIESNMSHEEIMKPETQAAIKTWPIPRVGLPEDVAGLVAFLASDHAAYITGQFICVDGGRVIG